MPTVIWVDAAGEISLLHDTVYTVKLKVHVYPIIARELSSKRYNLTEQILLVLFLLSANRQKAVYWIILLGLSKTCDIYGEQTELRQPEASLSTDRPPGTVCRLHYEHQSCHRTPS